MGKPNRPAVVPAPPSRSLGLFRRGQASVFASTGKYLILRISMSLVAMVTSIVLYRVIGPSEAGKLILCTSAIQLLGPIAAFGLPYIPIRFATKGDVRSQYLMAVGATAAVLLLLMLWLQWKPARSALPPELASTASLCLMIMALMSWQLTNTSLLRGRGNLQAAALTDGLFELMPRLIVMPLLLSRTITYHRYLLLQALVCFAVVGASSVLVFRQRSVLHVRRRIGMIPRAQWRFALNAMASVVVWTLFVNVPLWVVRTHGSPDDVGILGIAMRIPLVVIALLVTPMTAPLVYELTRDAPKDTAADPRLVDVTLVGAGLVGTTSLVMAGARDQVIPRLFGSEYHMAVGAFFVYAHLPFVAAATTSLVILGMVENRQQLSNLNILLAAALQFIVLFWPARLTSYFGGIAVSVGVVGLIGYATFAIAILWLATRESHGNQLPILVAALVMAYALCAGLSLLAIWPLAPIGFALATLAAARLWRVTTNKPRLEPASRP